MASELEKIRERLGMRAQMDKRDRARQAELVRERLAEGATWRQVMAEAGISKPTVSAIVHGPKPRRARKRKPPRPSS